MPPQPRSRKPWIIVAAVIIILAVAAALYHSKHPSAPAWKTYTQPIYGLKFDYPSDWDINDNMSPTTCCLFVVKYDISTTTTANASGTPITNVTAKERVKLQVGPYDTATFDPFKAASTTKTLIGKNEFYVGSNNGTPIYILPFTPTTGVGIALFSYPETPENAKDLAKQVISSITRVTPTATSTPAASTTKK